MNRRRRPKVRSTSRVGVGFHSCGVGDLLPVGGSGRIERMFTDDLSEDVVAAVDALVADDPAVLGFAGLLGRLRAVSRLVDRLEAERVRLLRVADRSGALKDDGAATAASWLRRNSTLTASQANTRAKIARGVPDLPVIAAAFAAGDMGVSHVTQVLGLCRDVGYDNVAEIQDALVEVSRRLRNVEDFTRICVGWRHALRPDCADEADERAYASRRLACSSTFDGAWHLNGRFDAYGGATLAAAINAYMQPDPPDTPPEERRDIAQRRADALVAMAEAALAAKEAGTVGGVRPRVVVRVNLADLISDPDHPDHHRLPGKPRSVSPPTVDWVGAIGPRLLAQLLDDCEIARVVFGPDGQLLDIGRATRVWPAAMRRAIVERDRGCRFFGCDRRPEWCDIDHVLEWEEGGPTAVWNGLLLCRYHHRGKRRDGWWPTLHPDGTVTWEHADGRVHTDPAPTVIDDHVRTLLNACDEANGDGATGYRYRQHSNSAGGGPTTAGESRGTYHPNRAPPRIGPQRDWRRGGADDVDA
jgi:hypothetical protein